MKNILVAILFLVPATTAIAQTCEEREKQLITTVGAFSAGYLYNTYGLIGSIADGFGHDTYKPDHTHDLLEAQKKVLDNMISVIGKLTGEGNLGNEDNINYMKKAAEVMKGLKKQAQLLQDYVQNKRQSLLNAYDEQRTKNWKAISKLMGIEE